MKVWALADLHLPFGSPKKTMSVFGPAWENYTSRIHKEWTQRVADDDLILIAGDVSWATRFEAALKDLEWIDQLPGKKILLKGNHDYWWPSNKQLRERLPQSISFVHKTALTINNVSIGGARLWDTPEYTFHPHIDFIENPQQNPSPVDPIHSQAIFNKELKNLRISLEHLDQNASYRIAMTHYPPISADLQPSQASQLLEEFHVNICVFGHLHSLKKTAALFGEKNHINYILTAADYVNFTPILIVK